MDTPFITAGARAHAFTLPGLGWLSRPVRSQAPVAAWLVERAPAWGSRRLATHLAPHITP